MFRSSARSSARRARILARRALLRVLPRTVRPLVALAPLPLVALAACAQGESSPVREGGIARAAERPTERVTPPPGVAVPTIGAAAYAVRPAQDAGRVEGAITLADGANVPADTTIVPDSTLQRACGATLVERTVVRRGAALAGVAVWLEGVATGKAFPEERRHAITLARCALAPRVLAVPVGGTLNVRTEDAYAARLRVVRWPEGRVVAAPRFTDAGQVIPEDRVLEAPGVLELRGEAPAWLRAWVVVAPHPYVGVTDEGGRFAFDGVPPGSYRLVAWHERLGRVERAVTVAPNGAATVDVVLGGGGG